jgi:hypothetical protein
MAPFHPNSRLNNGPPPAAALTRNSMNNAAAATSSGSSSNKNNPKDQFEKLVREKEAFLQHAAEADLKRSSLEIKTTNHRALQQQLLEKIRLAKDKAGSMESDAKSLLKNKNHLMQVYSVERAELIECSREIETLTMMERSEKRSFAKR